MMISNFRIILVTLFFCLGSLSAQAAILDIQEIKTKSGITAWLVEDKTTDVISIEYMFKGAGARNDAPEYQGLTRILSNTMDEGAGDLDSTAFQAALNQYSISLSFSAGRDDFGGQLKTLRQYKDKAFELWRLALNQPRFDDEAVRRMIDANKARILQDKTDPEWMLARIENDALYKDHPYAYNAGGTLTSLSKITPDLLRQKWKHDLTKDRLIIAVAGNISKQELAAVLDDVFSGLPASAQPSPKISTVDISKEPANILFKHEMPQSLVTIAGQGISFKDKDYYAAMVANQIFGGGGFGSRLTDIIREQKGLTYGIFSDFSEMDYAQLFRISTSVQNQNTAKLLKAIQDEAERMQTELVTKQDLAHAQSYLIGSIPLQLTSTSKIAGMMLSFQKWELPKNYLDVRADSIRQVTVDDIKRVAQRFFSFEKFNVIIVGQPENFKATRIYKTLPNVD